MPDSPVEGRPLSPHLQIWRFTVTMAASITHRGAGVFLYGGSVLLAVWVFSLAMWPGLYAVLSAFFGSSAGSVVIAAYVWSLSFHLLNGLRYLFWDAGYGFAIRTARITGWLAFGISAVLAAFIVFSG